MSCHPLLACKVSAENSADSLMRFPFYVISCFSLAMFKGLSLTLTILIIMYLDMYLFVFILFGIRQVSWTCMFISFPRLGKFSAIISSEKSSAPLFLFRTHIKWMLFHLMLSQWPLKLCSFFLILFFFSLLSLHEFYCFVISWSSAHWSNIQFIQAAAKPV